MRTAGEILKRLDQVGTRCVTLDSELLDAQAQLGMLLKEASDHPSITMVEAAGAALISRPMAYKLIRKSSRPDAE
jgi:hypothetical protein